MDRSLRQRALDTADNAVSAFAESVRETLFERVTRPKYYDAERVALGVLDERIGGISAKAKQTQKDKDVLEALKDIKSETHGSAGRTLDQPLVERRVVRRKPASPTAIGMRRSTRDAGARLES